MAEKKNWQPAGMSDEDYESDIDDWGQRIRKQHTSVLLPSNAPSLCQPGQPGQMTAKQRRNKMYWASQRNQPPVENPAFTRWNVEFFMKARQRNMDLEEKPDIKLADKPYWSALEPSEKFTSEIKLNPTQSSIILVNTRSTFQNMIRDIAKNKIIALDIEGHHDHSYLGWIALIQIATESSEYIIDPFEFTTEVTQDLKKILEDPNILKVIFAAHMEINWFFNDYHIVLNGMIDCQLLYRSHFRQGNYSSLKTAVEKLFPGFYLHKDETNSDWRRRPLTSSQLKYAQLDVYTLLRLFHKMRQMVDDKIFLSVIEESEKMTKKFDGKKVYPGAMEELDLENKRLQKAGRRYLDLTPSIIIKYQLLHQWRNRFAQMVDESPKNVLSLDLVVKISHLIPPISEDEIWKILKVSRVAEKYVKPQCTFILKILTEVYTNEIQMTAIVCHNCEAKGHPAVFCPMPVNKNASKIYMQKNPGAKKRQNRRRHQNLKKNKLKELTKSLDK